MAKRDITMSAAEVDEFLKGCRHMAVGGIGADGWPVGTIAVSSYDAGVLQVDLSRENPVAQALTTDSRVCCVADVHESYYEIRGVTVLGAMGTDGAVAIDRVISFDFGRLR